MLDDLVIAVESETQVVDIGRVSGFMQKVRPSRSPFMGRPFHSIDTMRSAGS
jgi:hypothetical protein